MVLRLGIQIMLLCPLPLLFSRRSCSGKPLNIVPFSVRLPSQATHHVCPSFIPYLVCECVHACMHVCVCARTRVLSCTQMEARRRYSVSCSITFYLTLWKRYLTEPGTKGVTSTPPVSDPPQYWGFKCLSRHPQLLM